MIPDKLKEVLNYESVVAIVTQGVKGPHVVNTWNSYLQITADGRLLGPVGGMNATETNVKENKSILMTIGSREVMGIHSKGTGFLIEGMAAFLVSGYEFEKMKEKFPWARAVLEITPETITQTL